MPIDQSEPIVQAEIIEGVKLLQQQQRIRQAMNLQEILEPEKELLQDSEETLLDQIGGQWDPLEPEDPEDH
ncbi:hypothetical protein GcM3_201026 [Golovinomyces cichoracearum]|uniref:Uncharacterized protein n=1 Tax=Golovinomyces cichoracearum TaxID=62708 RepID=A0A420HDD7_9PEZI|nr:hypothetical protein GcM3_201026 [Golovinomyces cichoracearum]